MKLANLPGVSAGTIEISQISSSVSGAMRDLRAQRAATGAGDHGAWTVWLDDAGKYRCEFSRHQVPVNEATYLTLTGVRGWLQAWLPQTKQRGAA